MQKTYTIKLRKNCLVKGGLKQAVGAQIIQDHGKIINFLNSYMRSPSNMNPQFRGISAEMLPALLTGAFVPLKVDYSGCTICYSSGRARYIVQKYYFWFIATVTRLLPHVKHLDFFWIYCCHIFVAFNCH